MAAPKLQPGVLGGLFIGVLSALPFVNLANCCCLWVITGGMLAAYVMQQNHPAPVTVGDGAVVGLLAGLVGGIVHYLVSLPLEMYLGPVMAGLSEGIMRSRGRQDMPPELRRLMNEMGPQAMLLIGSIMFAALSLVFATLGGILGVVFFRKPSPPPPPPPSFTPPPVWTAPPTVERPQWTPPPPPRADDGPPES